MANWNRFFNFDNPSSNYWYVSLAPDGQQGRNSFRPRRHVYCNAGNSIPAKVASYFGFLGNLNLVPWRTVQGLL